MEWYIYAFGSAIFTALLIIIEKKGLLKEHALEFSCVLSIFTFLLSLTFIRLVNFNLSLDILVLVALGSLFFSISNLFIAKAIRHMEISLAGPIMAFLPAFVLIFSYVILKESMNYLQLIGVLLLILGIYILEARKNELFKSFIEIFKQKHISYIILSLAFMALSFIIERYLLKDKLIDVYSLTFISYIFFMIYMIILIFVLHDGFKGIVHGFKNAGLLILFAATFMVVAKLLQNQANFMQNVTLVEVIRRTYVLIVIFLGGELFHEKNLFKKIIATLVMLIGAYLIIV